MAVIPKLGLKRKQRKCPICGKVTAAAHHPFCSKRCADIDLGRWLGGVYRVETEEKPEEGSATDGAAKEE